MARTAFTAPAHIVRQRNVIGNTATQPDSAPSLGYGGMNFLDPRLSWNRFNGLGNGVAAAAVGWLGQNDIVVLDYTPPANTTANIAALANVVAATPMTLVTSSGAGVVVTSSAFTAMPSMNVIPSPWALKWLTSSSVLATLPPITTPPRLGPVRCRFQVFRVARVSYLLFEAPTFMDSRFQKTLQWRLVPTR